MKTDIQQLIIVGLTVIALAFIIKNQFYYSSMIAVGLLGFIAPRTLSDKQSDELTDYYLQKQIKDEENGT